MFPCSRAIKTNQDLQPDTPIWSLFLNDFWGTPLKHSGSHKSYRPLCVLSFRFNYWLGGLHPTSYHVVNILLHALVTALFTLLARRFVKKNFPTLVAGILFASHPIHTEAVAGLVGRADIGACLFFIMSFLSYMKYCEQGNTCVRTCQPCKQSLTMKERTDLWCNCCDRLISNGCDRNSNATQDNWMSRCGYLVLTFTFATASLLTKEQGVTVLVVCGVYDVMVNNRVRLKEVPRLGRKVRIICSRLT